MSNILEIKNSKDPYSGISKLLGVLHEEGPVRSEMLESLALYKEFHKDVFLELEESIISAIGLFYKINSPANLYALLMSSVGAQHKKDFGELLTPVQASVRRAIEEKQFVSISAPTSAGKSYSIRDFIAEQSGDAVIVVPSRALIAEYMNTIRDRFAGDKTVMVSSFIDSVFTNRNLRRIFILTPERARELFVSGPKLSVNVFFFDEAQVSEEKTRGVDFDVLVRRVAKAFPKAKLIFAHPFVENPVAQFKKHSIPVEKGYARSYSHGAVGKISIFRHANQKDYYFSPFQEKGYLLTNACEYEGGFEGFAFNGQHSILIFVSKASIYNDRFSAGFEKYINEFPDIVDEEALEIIKAVEHMLGADVKEHRSKLVALLKKGVVIHHGSVPLEVRFLVEKFIRGKYAKICFATSTLAQGVNMPFDILWLQNMRMIGDGSDKSLSFKNLIGRAGRLTAFKKYDYGYVFTESPKLYAERLNDTYSLSEVSILDKEYEGDDAEVKEVIDSIKDGSFDDDYNMPQTKVARLSASPVLAACRKVLDIIYEGNEIRSGLSGKESKDQRMAVRENLKIIFTASIKRPLYSGEEKVFDTAIMIFLLAVSGRSFREIAGIRFSNISKRDSGRDGPADFAQPAHKLPDARLTNSFSLFSGVLARNVSYDAVVFDTYDYMDQVISFSLSDVFLASFRVYGELTGDTRAQKMAELLRYGTNNVMHMLLMRYGFPPESVSEISDYVLFVNEKEIVFSPAIAKAPRHIQDLTEWYRP
ncbi:DEAD/DEAH box helicase [Pseudomonas sp. LRP2-20]|uniref:DEAD/DEAH box helicase n=1 Tax=Pseudomonas sp. LRP2-20 TaxID=2944234 RepID=UPI002186F554|nr:DEAD/DEAH box helicase [Pseudomonas sp. LRP2-20]BDM22054.1 DEAD/DEAH box helicase [Pseudomonas sp. LRP2-20]